jgi:hypothetical protein
VIAQPCDERGARGAVCARHQALAADARHRDQRRLPAPARLRLLRAARAAPARRRRHDADRRAARQRVARRRHARQSGRLAPQAAVAVADGRGRVSRATSRIGGLPAVGDQPRQAAAFTRVELHFPTSTVAGKCAQTIRQAMLSMLVRPGNNRRLTTRNHATVLIKSAANSLEQLEVLAPAPHFAKAAELAPTMRCRRRVPAAVPAGETEAQRTTRLALEALAKDPAFVAWQAAKAAAEAKSSSKRKRRTPTRARSRRRTRRRRRPPAARCSACARCSRRRRAAVARATRARWQRRARRRRAPRRRRRRRCAPTRRRATRRRAASDAQ